MGFQNLNGLATLWWPDWQELRQISADGLNSCVSSYNYVPALRPQPGAVRPCNHATRSPGVTQPKTICKFASPFPSRGPRARETTGNRAPWVKGSLGKHAAG